MIGPPRRRSRRPPSGRLSRLLLLLPVAVASGACDDGPTEPDPLDPREPPPGEERPDTAPTPVPQVVGLGVHEPAPLVRMLDVELSAADSIEVLYWREGGERFRAATSGAAESHAASLVRLEADALYRLQVRPLSAPADSAAAVDSFFTAPLPDDLARLEFVAEGEPTHPLTVYEVTRNEGGFTGVVIVDGEGDVVWYRRGSVSGSTRRENGNFVFKQGGEALVEVTPTGQLVRQIADFPDPPDPHHDVITTPWNTLYVLAHDEQEIDGETVVGEAIWEWDPDGETLVKRWSAFDHLSWAEDRGQASGADDWLHANSLALGPGGNVLVSFAFLSQVISIRPDFSGIEWRLGGPNATIATSGDSEFHNQHTASELPASGGRRVLLFDNGTHARGYSRALELVVDPEAGTAEKAWEFVAPNRNHSFIVSLARRLENGNTFVHFGAGPGVFFSHGPVETYEVRPDGTVAWRLEVTGQEVDDEFVLYRAWPIGDLLGEVILEEQASAPGGIR